MPKQEINNWEFSRRQFVKVALIGGAISQIPFLASCENEYAKNEVKALVDGETYLIDRNYIRAVQQILFPKDELGPGALELKSDLYLIWVLNDQLLDPWDNEFVINGFQRLNKKAKEGFNKDFIDLNSKQQEDLISRASVSDWGEDFLSKILTLIFESMFANPNYGSNPDSIGWKWLNHQAGFPQPEKDQIYPTILDINKEKYKS